jgi:hypothetical protein
MPLIPKEPCDICKIAKAGVVVKKVGNKFHALCSTCIEDLKWVQKILEIGTNWIVEKHPDQYIKTSKFSVMAI